MTVDHLSVDHIVHVIHKFTDARGVAHGLGEEGLSTALAFNHASREIALARKRGETTETIYFLLVSRQVPEAIVYAANRRGDNCERAAGTLCACANDLLGLDRTVGRVTP